MTPHSHDARALRKLFPVRHKNFEIIFHFKKIEYSKIGITKKIKIIEKFIFTQKRKIMSKINCQNQMTHQIAYAFKMATAGRRILSRKSQSRIMEKLPMLLKSQNQ